MKVVLDASAVPPNPAGAGRYIVELTRRLAADDRVELALVTRNDDERRWSGLDAAVLAAAPRRRPVRLVWEQLVLPRSVRRLAADVFHGPHYTMPERARLPRVVTVHDLTFFDHPEWHERSKVAFFRRAIAVAARRADALVCVSEATARLLAERFPDHAPVHVVPHGVDHDRFGPDEPEPGHDAAVLEQLGVRPPYVAFVGTVEPRKNVPSLVRAFDLIASRHADLTLVIAGTVGWGEDDLGRALAVSAHCDRVVRTGFLADDAVPSLLRQAAAVAYPSLEEGFGLPALEALACGAPLVTTAASAMADVTGDAALLTPPGDAEALAVCLEELVAGRRTAVMRARGIEIAATYTWEATADRHVDVYKSVLAQ